VNNPKEVESALRDAFHDEEQDTLDWLTVLYPDGSWWNVRPSSNEPLLRLNLEARTQERFERLYAEVTEIISQYSL
jgi:phosphomannomutase